MNTSSPESLEDVSEFIVDCLHKTAPTQDTGYPLIRTPNIGKGRLELDNVYRVTEETYQEWTRRATPEAGDLILAREAPAGNVAVIKNGQQVCLGQRTVHIRPKTSEVDPDFLVYFLLAPKQQAALLSGQTGATAQHVNVRDIRRLPMRDLPDIATQQKIGVALAAYDDLIENNRRRIQLLEEAARLLYREWFVHLRFPGHEHVRVVDGVPEGWQRKPISEVAETLGGGTPSTKNPQFWESGDVVWFTPSDLTRNDCLALVDSEKKITEEGLRRSSAKLLPPRTILMSSRASIGFFGMYDGHAATNQGFIAIVPRDKKRRMFLLHHLMARVDEILNLAGGTTYREINKSTFRAFRVLVPPPALCKEFEEYCAAIFDQVLTLKKMNRKLAEARDLLLPRLVNGEIAV